MSHRHSLAGPWRPETRRFRLSACCDSARDSCTVAIHGGVPISLFSSQFRISSFQDGGELSASQSLAPARIELNAVDPARFEVPPEVEALIRAAATGAGG